MTELPPVSGGQTRAILARAALLAPKRQRKLYPKQAAVRGEAGKGLALMQRIQREHPRNPLRQVGAFFEEFYVPAATGRRRHVGIRTTQVYRETLVKAIRDLSELNMRIQNITELSGKHAVALMKLWVKRERSPSHLATLNTALRRMLTWRGRPDAVPTVAELFPDRPDLIRSYSATESKNWDTLGVDQDGVIEAVTERCKVVGLQLRMCAEFGLRVREAICLRPAVADQGDRLAVTGGTKGGRARSVPIEEESQRAALDAYHAAAKKDPKGLVSARQGRNIQENLDHFYNVLAAAGVTKAKLGVTAHGLRHTYANRKYERLTGQKSPVDGGGAVAPDVDKAARLTIAETLGHARIEISNHYNGQHQTIDRARRRTMQRLLGALEGDAALRQLAAGAQLDAVYVVGPQAAGHPVTANTAVLLAYELRTDAAETPALLAARSTVGAAIAARVGELLSCTAACSPLQEIGGRNQQTLELAALTR